MSLYTHSRQRLQGSNQKLESVWHLCSGSRVFYLSFLFACRNIGHDTKEFRIVWAYLNKELLLNDCETVQHGQFSNSVLQYSCDNGHEWVDVVKGLLCLTNSLQCTWENILRCREHCITEGILLNEWAAILIKHRCQQHTHCGMTMIERTVFVFKHQEFQKINLPA